MTYPSGVITRQVSFGGASTVESGEPLKIQVTTVSSRSLIWRDTGYRLESLEHTLTTETPGEEVFFEVPVTDQNGWNDAETRQAIIVNPGESSHTYTSTLRVYDGQRMVRAYVIGPYPVANEPGVLDGDLISTEADPIDGTLTVYVPGPKGDVTPEAEEAATRAEDARDQAEVFAASTVELQDTAIAQAVSTPGSASETAVDARVLDQVSTAGPVLEALNEAYPAKAGLSSQSPAYSFIRGLREGATDITWLHLGDSTSRGTKPWPRTALDLLAASYPEYSAEYIAPADVDPLAYQAPDVRQTGTGTKTLRLYSASRSGKTSLYVTGSNWNIIEPPTAPDLITVSYGHNDPATREFFRGQYTALVETLKARYPYAEVILVAQNPATNNNTQVVRTQEIVSLARMRGYGLLNVYDMFMQRTNWKSTLMNDDIHPNEAGHDLIAAAMREMLTWNSAASPISSSPSSFLQPGENLSPEGMFLGWSGSGVPSGFTVSGPVTVSKDTVNYESKGYGVKVSAAGPSGILQYDLPADRLRLVAGQDITLAVRLFIPDGSPAGAGRIGFRGDIQLVGNPSTEGQGAFRWAVFTGRVTTNPVVVRLFIYASDSNGTNGGSVTVDRIITCRGALPRDDFAA